MELITPGIGLVFWTGLTFLFVWLVLGKFAFKPIAEALNNRSKSIEDALEQANRAKEEMKQLQADNESLLREARAERDSIIKEAKASAEKMVATAQDKASAEADKIIKQAQETIQSEKNAAMAEIRKQVANITIDVAEKVLRKELSDTKSQQGLVNDYLDSMKLN